MKVHCYILDTVGQTVLYQNYANSAEGNRDFLNLAFPSTTFPVHSALPRGHVLVQASIPDDGTSKKVSLQLSVESFQDVLMVARYKSLPTLTLKR